MSQTMGITGVLKTIDENTDGDQLSAGDILNALDNRGYGPLLLAGALITLLPTGAIPGVPTITGILIILVAGQMLVGRKTPWLPRFLLERSFDKAQLEKTRKVAEPYTQRFDRILKPRLEVLVSDIAVKLVAALCILLASLMPPLEVVPFAAFFPAIAVAVMAVGLSAKDGAVMLTGVLISFVVVGGAVFLLF